MIEPTIFEQGVVELLPMDRPAVWPVCPWHWWTPNPECWFAPLPCPHWTTGLRPAEIRVAIKCRWFTAIVLCKYPGLIH